MAIDLLPTVLYSIMLGVVVLAMIQAGSKPKTKQTKFLFALLTLLLMHILGELYIFSGAYQYAPALAGFQLPIRMLLGPALFFYAYMAMATDKQLTFKSYLLATLGPVVVLLGMIPFIFLISPEQKLALASPLTRDPELWKIAKTTCFFSAMVFIIVTFSYLAATFKLHVKHRTLLMNRYSSIEKRSMDWLRVMLILWGLVWTLYTVNYVSTFIGSDLFKLGSLLPLVELIILVCFTHLAINQTEINEPKTTNEDNKITRTQILTEAQMQEIAKKLNLVMVSEQIFKDEELSLSVLSSKVEVSENYISETLSQYLKTNFFQFVNGFRIEAAKKLLTTTDMAITTVLYEVGFKSKSTFNSAFKKMVGTTPSMYKKASVSPE